MEKLRKHRLILTAGAVMAAAAALPARATLVAYEDFEGYTNGASLSGLNGGTGWDTAWATGGTGTKTVVNASLSYAAGDILINGGSLALQLAFSDATADLPANRSIAPQTGTLYAGLLYRETVNTGDSDFAQFGWNSTAANPTLSILDSTGVFQARAGTAGGNTSGVTSTFDQTFFLVFRIENTGGGAAYDQVTLFVNPTSSVEGANPSVNMSSADVLNLSSDAFFVMRRAFQEAGDTYQVDALRIGTTFADVITVVPEPGSLGLLMLGASGLLALRGRNPPA